MDRADGAASKFTRSLATRKPVAFAALLSLAALVLGACGEVKPQDVLSPAGKVARQEDRLWDITFLVAVVIFVIVEGLLVYAIVRFRERPGRQAEQFHGNTKLEIVWTVIPSLILAAIAVPTVRTIFDLSKEPTADDAGVHITVTARQFWWEYEYVDEGIITANEMHVPTNTAVYLTLQGVPFEIGGDRGVIHSFWVPRLFGTQDVIPGRTNGLTFYADEPGRYLGQCKEFCGVSHANMRIVVIAHEPQEYEAWVAQERQEALDLGDRAAAVAQEGENVFLQTGCPECHAIRGVTEADRNTGPDLTHFGSRTTFAGAMFENNRQNLAAWIDDPRAVKPGSLMPDYGLDKDQIDAVVAYLLGLK